MMTTTEAIMAASASASRRKTDRQGHDGDGGHAGPARGMKDGDYLTHFNGKLVYGGTLDEAVDQMKGPPGSTVTVTCFARAATSLSTSRSPARSSSSRPSSGRSRTGSASSTSTRSTRRPRTRRLRR
jgi:hypothetical protein